MVVLRVPFPLNIPVLDCPDDMGLVCLSELEFNLVPSQGLWVLKEKVESPRSWLYPLSIPQDKIA
jgi:hypothetical protein